MKNIDKMTDEEIIAEMRDSGKKEGTMEHFLYSLLSTAHPNVIKMMESQAVQMKKVGYAIGKEFQNAENDPQKKAQIMSILDNAVSGFSKPDDKDETPDT